MDFLVLVWSSLVICSTRSSASTLRTNYYEKTCPQAEPAIANVVRKAAQEDKTVPAALLRMHFHDCFIRYCLSVGPNTAEKDGSPNVSVHAFYVIDSIKKEVESLCPGVVSCADILALATRDLIAISGGPTWDVPKGRKDGRTSLTSETRQSPLPTFNLSQLQQSFLQRGLSDEDLVVLSGGHTLGFPHCFSFQNQIHRFNATYDIDPSMDPSFAARLQKICPEHSTNNNAGANMETSPTTFDNKYYKLILQGRNLFPSDQALLISSSTINLVTAFAGSQEAFFNAFVKSMTKMSRLTGGKEVRKNCRAIN